MASVADLVHQQSSSTGTGTLALSEINGRRTFSAVFGTGATQNVFYYFISSQAGAEWEVGTGHMSNSTTLVRDTVVKSSNSDALVSFSGGILDVMNDVPAGKQLRNEGAAPSDGDIVVFDGTSGEKIKGAGVGRKGPTVQVFTSSGTWTKPAGCVKIKATVIGGGGGGGGAPATTSNSGVGAGGGAGGMATSFISVTSTSSISVTIGAGGAGGVGNANGSGGGTSTFSTLSAVGGSGGGRAGPTTSVVLNAGGAGGSASGGDIIGYGSPGFPGASGGGASAASGAGGSSFLGGGGAGTFTATTAAGNNGVTKGSGGSGAVNVGTQSAQNGGAGADGIVIVEEYYA